MQIWKQFLVIDTAAENVIIFIEVNISSVH